MRLSKIASPGPLEFNVKPSIPLGTLLAAVFAFSLTACSSTPTATGPEWTKGPTRTVDNGYIIYTGWGEDVSPEHAQFLAEGMALQDLASECTLIPKGSRVEDRYSEKQKYTTKAYAKVAVEFQECDEGKKTATPEAVRQAASAPFTEELKKYQDQTEVASSETEGQEVEMPKEVIEPAPQGGSVRVRVIESPFQYYTLRQYVVYQKETVVLAPTTQYAPGSPESQTFVSQVQPATDRLTHYEKDNPTIKSAPMPYSKLETKPVVQRPMALRPTGAPGRGQGIRPPGGSGRSPGHGAKSSQQNGHNPGQSGPRPHRRKHQHL